MDMGCHRCRLYLPLADETRMMNKKKMKKSKKKNEYISCTVDAFDGNLEFTYDPEMGSFMFSNSIPGSLHQKIIYERDSGKEKVVLSAPCTDQIGRFETVENLRNNFDFIFAVDTNTGVIADEKISISVCYYVPKRLSLYKESIPFLPLSIFEINCVKEGVNPEIIGWHILIKTLHDSPTFKSNSRIGIIVDSELGKIPDINTRSIPYYETYYLPQPIQLIYASSDTGKEYLPNQMISYCDKLADRCIVYFREKGLQTNKRVNGDQNFFGYRLLNFKRESVS